MSIEKRTKEYFHLHDIITETNKTLKEAERITISDLKAEYPHNSFEDFTFEEIYFDRRLPCGSKIIKALGWELYYDDDIVVKFVSIE